DLSEQYSFVVSGNDTGKNSQILLDVVNMIHLKAPQDKIFVIDSNTRKMDAVQNDVHFYAVNSEEDRMTQVMEEIVQYLNERKRAQNAARAVSTDSFDEESFIQDYEQLCIFVNNLKEFVDSVSEDNLRSMERICRLAQG
ncbi:hypothetical protein CQR39_14410, partial [Enterococcus faecium]|uniref:hypothetical protein n=1 Tax=Enterococcus faecium TaxID=1352 RepID=UPI000C066F79